ncbi:MAG: ABC transporter ATP-binding protein [Gemmatimonadetes bacterium]|nr:ABC transporter ATP-binding protein [Gemmatimonadota bacterium]
MSALLAAEGLTRRYGERVVVDVAHLAISRGEVLAVLGPNGAGKSTLFRLLLLLERPDAGRVLLDGRPVEPGDENARRRLAGVFQRPHLFSGTVRDNLRFGLAAAGVRRSEWRARTDRVAGELGLAGLVDARVGRLSGGEAQRVALARALVLEPDVLLLDEPTAGLDATIRRRFREELGGVLRERAGAVVLITHDAADAFDLADRVAVMEGGRIAQVGTPEDLTTDPATPFVAAFTGAELLLDGVVETTEEGTVRVRAGDARLVARAPEPALEPGTAVHVRYRPEDVTLAPADVPDVSARNHLPMRVRSTTPSGGLIRVRLEGPIELAALVTRESAERLGIRPGAAVTALLKSTALHVYAAHR